MPFVVWVRPTFLHFPPTAAAFVRVAPVAVTANVTAMNRNVNLREFFVIEKDTTKGYAPFGMYIIVTAVLTIAAAAAQLSVLY